MLFRQKNERPVLISKGGLLPAARNGTKESQLAAFRLRLPQLEKTWVEIAKRYVK